jgi:zinc transport system substrate-binding protein
MRPILKTGIRRYLLVVFAVSVMLSFTFSRVEAAAEKIPVFVSILPQKFFVEQIGKERVDVQVMVQPGASPHTYEPKPRQMAALSKTGVYFAIGLPFEKVWLEKISASNKYMKIIHTDEGIAKIQMKAEHHHEEEAEHKEDGKQKEPSEHKAAHNKEDKGEKEPDETHAHSDANGEPDPHIWLSPKLVAIQAQHILEGLKSVDPDYATLYDANYRTFILQITKLDEELKGIFADRKGIKFMVFHPSWGYFARDYQLEELPVEIEGKNPRPAQLQELINNARENKISIIFVQPQFSVKSARQIAREINAEVVFADPLAYEWIENLRDVSKKFKSALK